MQSFLDASSCRNEIKRMLGDGNAVRAAVAYWGVAATKELGIAKGMDLTVVCDVRGGGSNPDEVKELIRLLGTQKVLTHDGLHAKTWVGVNKAIVGSSNASANGLGKEGSEVASLVEANLLTNDPTVITSLNAWLDDVVFRNARIVTDDDLNIGADRHRRRRDGRAMPEVGDLLSLLRTEPESFVDRNVFVWVWDPNSPAEWAFAELASIQADRNDKSIDFYQDVSNPPPPPGAYILDFGGPSTKAKFVGLYQVLKDHPIHQTKNKSGSLLLCRPVKMIEGIPIGDRAIWRSAARRAAALRNRDTWQIVEFARQFLP